MRDGGWSATRWLDTAAVIRQAARLYHDVLRREEVVARTAHVITTVLDVHCILARKALR